MPLHLFGCSFGLHASHEKCLCKTLESCEEMGVHLNHISHKSRLSKHMSSYPCFYFGYSFLYICFENKAEGSLYCSFIIVIKKVLRLGHLDGKGV